MPVGRYAALLDERARLIAEGEDIFNRADKESRSLTDAEKARDDEIQAKLNDINADLEREERRRERERMVDPTAGPRVTQIRDLGQEKPWGFNTFKMTAEEFIARRATPFLTLDNPAHPANVYSNAAAGEYLQAVFKAAKGFGTDQRLIWEAAAQGAGEFVGADGGFVVPRMMEDRIKLRMTAGQVLSRVNSQTLTNGNSIDINVIDETSRATGSRHGAVQGYRLDEGTAITASRPKFAKLSFKLKKYAALGYASDELLADAALVGRVIFDAFGDELRFMAEDDIINGTGSGTPQGILIANALVSVTKETGQAAATFLYENVVKMFARFHAANILNAVWFVNQDVFPQLFTMSLSVGTGGAPVYLPPNGAAGAPLGMLLGRPVVPIEYCATLGTVGDVILADLGEYWFYDKGEPQQASSMHVAFTTDEQAFRVVYRADGRSSWIAPLTPYKGGANTQSHIVALATRA